MEQGNKKNIVIILLVVIIVALLALVVLLGTGTISFKSKNNTTSNSDAIQSKLVDNLPCNNSETTFNGITIKLEQQNNNSRCMVNTLTVNGKDIKNDILTWVNSYEIYDNNVIIYSSSTSSPLLTIYNIAKEEKVLELGTFDTRYTIKSYKTENDKILITGKSCAGQCSNDPANAVFPDQNYEIDYLGNGLFTEIKKIDSNNITSNNNEAYKSINLEKEKETFDFDKLHLEFNGSTYKTDEGHYQYVLNIKYDGKDLNNTFFNDKDNYRIWSHNMAANFEIYKVDNIYILVSLIARQCFCNEVMILNTDGEVLKTIARTDFKIDEKSINLKASDNGQCMGPDWETHVTEYNYIIDGSKLTEQ